jgi:hypothetical protein
MLLKKLMLVDNQSCTVTQRTLQNKNNALNYECARPDRLKVTQSLSLYLGGRGCHNKNFKVIFNNCHLLMTLDTNDWFTSFILEMSKKCWPRFRVRNSTCITLAMSNF